MDLRYRNQVADRSKCVNFSFDKQVNASYWLYSITVAERRRVIFDTH